MSLKILNIGHRGAKGHVVENTLESIKKALEIGVDGVEIDVHLCASGELVVFHDFTLDRMTNGSGEITKHSLSELKSLKVKGKFTIPTLQEVLDVIDKRCFLNIELKGKNTALKACRTIQYNIEASGWVYKDFIVSSFQHSELNTVFKIDKNIPLGVLTKASVSEAVMFAKTIQAVAVHPNYDLITKENVHKAQLDGLKVIAWTVNEKETIQRLKSYGVNGIITDFPDRF